MRAVSAGNIHTFIVFNYAKKKKQDSYLFMWGFFLGREGPFNESPLHGDREF